MKYRLDYCINPIGWVFVELSEDKGYFRKRLCDDMLCVDVNGRRDIQINEYGVVLFIDNKTARMFLDKPSNTVFKMTEYKR